ncbi:hypothetical protein LJC81_31710 [Streptomyces californicus]|nr:hypothetical protein [Streptomyces californicus]
MGGPPVGVAGGAGEVRTGHPAPPAVGLGEVNPDAAEVPGPGQPVQRAAARLLPVVGQLLGQHLVADRRAFGQPVDVPGDGRLTRLQPGEVVGAARCLIGGVALSVPGFRHGVGGRAQYGTKVGGSHGDPAFLGGDLLRSDPGWCW